MRKQAIWVMLTPPVSHWTARHLASRHANGRPQPRDSVRCPRHRSGRSGLRVRQMEIVGLRNRPYGT
jgi:hypothetical protein